jgi:hypothetical protein
MNQGTYNAAIVVHIIGISFLAGATVIDFLSFRIFWKSIAGDRNRSIAIVETGTLYQKVMGIGMGLIILSGIAMMVYMHGVWGQQLWFRIKFGLLLLVIVNGLGIRRILGIKLNKIIYAKEPQANGGLALSRLKGNISIIHVIQFILLVSIFTLSVFKFN